MSNDIKSIGFIGLGSMGAAQARELAKLPIPLIVFDIVPKAMNPFAGKATLAANLAQLGAMSDCVGICVQDDRQVYDCVDELLPAMKPGAIILIHSTVHPSTMLDIAHRCRMQRIAVLDAAVTRTKMTSGGPFVFSMLGGDAATVKRAEPVLAAYSTNVMHVGPTGSAMALKICNNLVSWCEIMLGLEVAQIAEAAAVPLDKLMAVMASNGVMTPPMRAFLEFRSNPGDQEQRKTMAVQGYIGEKDLSLATDLAQQACAPSPIAEFIRDRVQQGIRDLCQV